MEIFLSQKLKEILYLSNVVLANNGANRFVISY